MGNCGSEGDVANQSKRKESKIIKTHTSLEDVLNQ
jgi:hypothetical protein